MNCRRLAKYLPELVAGELDEKTARLAEEHIEVCPGCAAERAKYERALGALSRANAMVEVPAALDVLHIPDEQPARRMWLQPAMATLAVAAILALIVLMPQPFRRAPEVTRESPEIVRIPLKQPKTIAEKPNPGKRRVVVANMPRPPAGPRLVALAGVSRPTPGDALAYVDKPKKGAPVSEISDEPLPEPTAIVVAYDPGDELRPAPAAPRATTGGLATTGHEVRAEQPVPSVVEIESTDSDTGAMIVYNYSRDSEGRERVIEMTSNVCADAVGGTNP